ncbi:Dienelactone hydrolase endo-1,3,1,4-beta-D-glucanase [Mycena indigotica]|uniref:Dienelactone hydrolase endo-1,3,1,4-beta-D-glucanase n=1 Tax=Mycena indigotica TaxID=2126181 RepID=A0A8H6W1F4_9AGAR|nr:Dienelactone hydrolase endo-1,3,1,4-beta-D-glucanase [Mycena indigotica]KAF7299461.1 Dienelactone hydrolase endo-1,3,1,4-beta-D-glucanase [Mycena indigotica]
MEASDECCFTGSLHEGQPNGTIKNINDVPTYCTMPLGGVGSQHDTNAIIYLPDVFGMQLVNNQLEIFNKTLKADRLTDSGYNVYMPDYLNGDPRPGSVDQAPPTSFNVNAWKAAHTVTQTRPPLDKVIAGLKNEGYTVFAATGYCFGARYVVDLALENAIQVAVISHPSQLLIPFDIDALVAASNVPLLINSCEFDPHFPQEWQSIADEKLGAGKYAPGYKRTYWEGCSHGFLTKGDLSDSKVKSGQDGAVEATIAWIREHLQNSQA